MPPNRVSHDIGTESRIVYSKRVKGTHHMRLHPDTRIDVICPAAPWENTTTDADRAVDLAYSLSEEFQCDVDLRYNSTGIIFQTVSNY